MVVIGKRALELWFILPLVGRLQRNDVIRISIVLALGTMYCLSPDKGPEMLLVVAPALRETLEGANDEFDADHSPNREASRALGGGELI
jgi:hypothetical protein